jgi:hypothetical protein
MNYEFIKLVIPFTNHQACLSIVTSKEKKKKKSHIIPTKCCIVHIFIISAYSLRKRRVEIPFTGGGGGEIL